jgi:aspartyl-tRNA(Asn)/glutamyl-tRNA(Gln) amidotransferase subunit A
MPSSFCGCWGLKPTTGRLSTSGMMPMAASLDCPGPMTSTAEDLELAWRVMSAATEWIAPEAPGSVAVLRGWFSQADPSQLAAVDAAAALLEGLGATVTEQEVDGLDDIIPVWRGVAWTELAEAHGHLLETPELLSAPMRRQLGQGMGFTPEERGHARRRAVEIAAMFAGLFGHADLLLAPTTPFPAPRADAETVELASGREIDVHRGGPAWFTEPFNLAGLPVVAAPAGFSPEGLPLSVSLIGPRNGDERVLAAALTLEARDERFRSRVAPRPKGMGATEPPLGGER